MPHIDRMVRRARRGRRLHAAAGPQADAARRTTNRSETMLAEGELDAVIHSEHHQAVRRQAIRGCAGCCRTTSRRRSRSTSRTGIFPIMHVMGIKREIVDQHPWMPINMYHAFNKSKAIAMEHMKNPRIVPLAWYQEAWEEQE